MDEGKCIPMVLKAASPSMWPRGLCTGVSQRLVVTISLFLMFALREVHSADRAEDRLWAPNTNTCWRGQCQAEFEMVPGNRGQFGVVLRLRGGRKGVSAKHTSKEMAEKHKLATKNMGGGKEGLQDRLGGKAGHAKFVCPLPGCNMQAPSIRNMQDHHESKHPKIPWDPSIYVNAQEIHGGSTKGVAVHGTLKTDKLKAKAKKEKAETAK